VALMTYAGPTMAACMAIVVCAVLVRELWAEMIARAIGLFPDAARIPVMESLERGSKNGSVTAREVLAEMGGINAICPVCRKPHDADELNFGKHRRCGNCATWGRYPKMPKAELEAANEAERQYNKIALQNGLDAANDWLANRS